MDVAKVMSIDVVTVCPETPLREVARLLTEHRISGMPVLDGEGRVCGVVSSTDLLPKEFVHDRPKRRLLGRRSGVSRADARTAGEAMTQPAVSIRADRPLWEAASLMHEHGVNRLPVAGPDGGLVGIVTRADLVRAFIRPDEEIEAELTETLADLGIDVECRSGEVTLRGVVGSRAAAGEVVDRVARVAGVSGVCSRLMWGDNPKKLTAPLHFLSKL